MTEDRCDICGKGLPVGPEGRFVVRIEVFAPAGPLEITDEDLRTDHADEIRRLIEQLSRMTAQEVEDGVYRLFRFNLCPPCQREYLRDPLGGLRST